MRAKIGVQLFSIPAYPVEIPVSANVNRKAGAKFPRSPTIASFHVFFHCSFFKARMAIGNKNNAAIHIRIAATWVCVKIDSPEVVCMPSFIKIKLLPQIVERTSNKIQF